MLRTKHAAPPVSPLIFSRSLIFSSNLYNHTLSNRSHKNLVGFAHLNTCRICTYSS
ncbi:hypothetical protein CPL00220_CDS0162 [Escherichia phage Baret]